MGTLFLVEEYIEGQDLRQWTAQNFPFIVELRIILKYIQKKLKTYYYNFSALIDNIHRNGVAIESFTNRKCDSSNKMWILTC